MTSRFYGETEELLPKYAWYEKNSGDRTWPVGTLKPNDWGFFDIQGNVFAWCMESYRDYPAGKGMEPALDKEDESDILPTNPRAMRGGSFRTQQMNLRSANRDSLVPTFHDVVNGFRVARTFVP